MVNLKEIDKNIRSARKSDDTEDYLDVIFNNPLGFMFAKQFIRLKWTPNQVTLLRTVIGFGGSLLFIFGRPLWDIAAIALITLALILDATDGQVARLTGQSSELGRTLDGTADALWIATYYTTLALRLISKPVFPGSPDLWGWKIVALSLAAGVLGCALQNQVADRYRSIHLHLLDGKNLKDLESAENDRKRAAGVKGVEGVILRAYAGYIRSEEQLLPAFERLKGKILSDRGGVVPEGIRQTWLNESRKRIFAINLFSINTRTLVMFICVLINRPVWAFVFDLVVLGPLMLVVRGRLERLAKELTAKS